MVVNDSMSALTEVWYKGTSLSEIWYGENKVWPSDGSNDTSGDTSGNTSGDTSGNYLMRYTTTSGTTYTIPCSSGNTASNLTLIKNLRENGDIPCSALTSADIGDCCEVVGASLFDNVVQDYGLTSVTVSDNVKVVETQAFETCKYLVHVKLPSGLTEITDYLFQYDYELTDVVIPSGVTSIGKFAFADCYSLLDVVVPSSVTAIGESAFHIIKHSGLSKEKQRWENNKIAALNTNRKITFLSTVPPSLEQQEGVFNSSINDNPMSYKLYVPSESVDAYKEAWYLYADRIVPITNT